MAKKRKGSSSDSIRPKKKPSPLDEIPSGMRGLSKAGVESRMREELLIQKVIADAKKAGTYRGPDWEGTLDP